MVGGDPGAMVNAIYYIYFSSAREFLFRGGGWKNGDTETATFSKLLLLDTWVKIRPSGPRTRPTINRGARYFFARPPSKKRTVWRCHRKTIPFLPANDARFSPIVGSRSI